MPSLRKALEAAQAQIVALQARVQAADQAHDALQARVQAALAPRARSKTLNFDVRGTLHPAGGLGRPLALQSPGTP